MNDHPFKYMCEPAQRSVTPPELLSSSVGSSSPESTLINSFPTASFCLDQGAQFTFFNQYIYAGTGPSKTELNWLVPTYQAAKPDGTLSEIVAALGLLALAKGQEDRSIELIAAKKYTSALRKTHSCLKSVSLAKSDETLATVVLLALHEVRLGPCTSPLSYLPR